MIFKRKVKTTPIGAVSGKEYHEYLKNIDLGYKNKDITLEQIFNLLEKDLNKKNTEIRKLKEQINDLSKEVKLLSSQLDSKLSENLSHVLETGGN